MIINRISLLFLLIGGLFGQMEVSGFEDHQDGGGEGSSRIEFKESQSELARQANVAARLNPTTTHPDIQASFVKKGLNMLIEYIEPLFERPEKTEEEIALLESNLAQERRKLEEWERKNKKNEPQNIDLQEKLKYLNSLAKAIKECENSDNCDVGSKIKAFDNESMIFLKEISKV